MIKIYLVLQDNVPLLNHLHNLSAYLILIALLHMFVLMDFVKIYVRELFASKTYLALQDSALLFNHLHPNQNVSLILIVMNQNHVRMDFVKTFVWLLNAVLDMFVTLETAFQIIVFAEEMMIVIRVMNVLMGNVLINVQEYFA